MHPFRILLILSSLLKAGFFSVAQNTFTVQQAVEYAIKNEANVKNAFIDRDIAQKKVNELIGIGLPQINIEADATRFLKIPTTFVPAEFFGGEPGTFAPVQFGQNYTASAGVTASQLLFDGSYLVGVQASKTYAELSKKTYEQTKIEAAEKVMKAYYSVLVNEERLASLNANVQRLKKLRDDTKALFENGFVEKMDLDRTEVAYNNLLSTRDQSEKLLALAKGFLKFQMGMDPKADLVLADNLQSITFESSLADGSMPDFKNRIEYSILETTQKLQQLDLKKNRFQYLPSLVAYGSFSYNASRNEFDLFDTDKKWYPTSLIGAKISLPVFDGLQKRSRIQQSKLNLEKIKNGFTALEQGLTLESMKAQTDMANSISALEAQRKNRDLANDVVKTARIKYEQGVGSNLEIISAETDLRDAETNYYAALYQALVAQTDLQKAKGTLLKNY